MSTAQQVEIKPPETPANVVPAEPVAEKPKRSYSPRRSSQRSEPAQPRTSAEALSNLRFNMNAELFELLKSAQSPNADKTFLVTSTTEKFLKWLFPDRQ